jgi:hypothetical protein
MTTKIFEPTFNEITEFETEVNNLLKKFNTPTKTRKFRIELIDKSSFRIFKCCNIILPADTVMVMTIEMRSTGATNVPTAFPITSVILRDSGTIEAIPGRNRTEPDCFLLCAGAKLVERYLDSFSTDFKSDTCNGKIRQFLRILDKLPRESNLETALGIASTFENY